MREYRSVHSCYGLGHTEFMEKLVELMPPEILELQDMNGYTALHNVATNGDTKAAEILVNKNPNLTQIRNGIKQTPILRAAVYGHKKLVLYLCSKTRDEDPSPFRGVDDATLLGATIIASQYDLALHLLGKYPEMATNKDWLGRFPISLLAIKSWPTNMNGEGNRFWQRYTHSLLEKPNKVCANALKRLVPSIRKFYNTKMMHRQYLEVMARMCKQIALLSDGSAMLEEISGTVLLAAEHGNIDYIKSMLKLEPSQVWFRDNIGQGMLHVAIKHRQEKAFMYLKGLRWKDQFASWIDGNGDTILHLAAKLAPPSKLKAVSGAALQVQHELQWYKEVEKIVQPLFKDVRNKEWKSPRELFTAQHEKLVEQGEKWMKDMASSSMVVATLIATVVFAAAFTVPGGNIEGKGIPIFLHTRSYLIFSVSNALALFSSLTSVLIFLFILTARYAEEDFLKSLPQKMIIGLAMLFFAIATMTIAFSATYFIMLGRQLAWVSILVALLTCFPVTLFAFLQFPLFLEMVHSTYRSTL